MTAAPGPYSDETKSWSPTTSGVAALTEELLRDRQRFWNWIVPVAGSSPSKLSRVRKTAVRCPPIVAATPDEELALSLVAAHATFPAFASNATTPACAPPAVANTPPPSTSGEPP